MANSSLRNLVSFLVQKRYLNTFSKIRPSPSPLPQITKDSNFALHFLTNTCGLPLKSAISVSNTFPIQEKNEKKLQSVINYLKDEGFTQTHISIFIHKLPRVLHSNVETTLKPKFEFLKQNGFVGELLIEVLVNNPNILIRSLDLQMKPALELMRSYIVSDDKIVCAIRRSSWFLLRNYKNVTQPNIEFLVKQGVPSTCIAKILILDTRVMCVKLSRLIYTVNTLKNLGCQPTTPIFVHAFLVMSKLSESTWKKKFEFLQSFGWTREDVLSAFKRHPQMMGYSVDKFRKSIDFYRNTMKFNMQTIITNPVLLGLAIDTRVRPRYIIFKILKSRKLIQQDTKIITLIKLTDKAFLDKYIVKYKEDVPRLFDTYIASKMSKASSPSDLLQLLTR